MNTLVNSKLKVEVSSDAVKTYARPSKRAIIVNEYTKGAELTVYHFIKGWYELRPVDVDGIMNTEFISSEDVNLI